MEHARAVTRRWEERAPGWAPLFPEPVTKELLPGTNDDDLSPLALIAAHAEKGLWQSLLEAWSLVASHVNMADLTHAVERGSELDVDRFLLPGLSATLMTERMIPRFLTTYRHGIEFAMGHLHHHKQLHPTGDEPYRAAAIWAQQHAGTLITHINERQRQAVRDLIEQANREGLTPDEVAVLLRQTIGLRPDQSAAATRFRQRLQDEGVSRAQVRERTRRYQGALQRQRTRMIARTELITAANAGQMALWAEAIRMGRLPRNPYKRWIVTEDERLCPTCEALGARDPIPVAEEWLPGVLFPAAHPNCRCAIALVPDGGAVLMRGGGIISLRGVGFDPLARVAARNAVPMWAAIYDALHGLTPTPSRNVGSIVESGVREILGAMQGTADLSVINVETGVPTMNYLGMWKDSTNTLSLSYDTTNTLFALFTQGDRSLAQRSDNLYGAISTVVHEGFHVLSAMTTDTYGNSREQFLEEGLVEMRARRVTAALVFGKLKRTERLAGYRALASATGRQPYEQYVDRLRWYERTVVPKTSGTLNLRRLHEDVDPQQRQIEITDSLIRYLTRFARDNYRRKEVTAIVNEINKISMVRMIGALQLGILPDLTGIDPRDGSPNMDAKTFYRTIQLIQQGTLIIP